MTRTAVVLGGLSLLVVAAWGGFSPRASAGAVLPTIGSSGTAGSAGRLGSAADPALRLGPRSAGGGIRATPARTTGQSSSGS